MMSIRWTLIFVAVVAIQGVARSEILPGTPMPPDPSNQLAIRRMSLVDQGFFKAAVAHLATQEQLGALVEEHGATPMVRELGRQLAQKRQGMGLEFTRLAQAEGLTLPETTPLSRQPRYMHLRELSGAEFDRAFLDQQRIDLAEEVTLFKSEVRGGTHASLRDFARKHLRQLRRELKSLGS